MQDSNHNATLMLSTGTQIRGRGYGYAKDTIYSDITINMQDFNLEQALISACNSESILFSSLCVVGGNLSLKDISNFSCTSLGLVVGQLLDNDIENINWDKFLSSKGIPCIAINNIDVLLKELMTTKSKIYAKIVFDNPTRLQIPKPLIGMLPNYTIGDKPDTMVVIDLGVDQYTKDVLLSKFSLKVFVDFDYNQVVACNPKFILFSDGVGNPNSQRLAINLIKANLLSKDPIPMIGIGIGHFVLAISMGLKLTKRPIGLYGINAI
ncbi:MAG: hypothetical protein FWF58_02020, partial [Firmicutes bacterium]|nr:hypothetical protein [Bacillota bacterium]